MARKIKLSSGAAAKHDLIRVKDLTKYELSNPIMDTLGGVSYLDLNYFRSEAIKLFWTDKRWKALNKLIRHRHGIGHEQRNIFLNWNSKPSTTFVDPDSYPARVGIKSY